MHTRWPVPMLAIHFSWNDLPIWDRLQQFWPLFCMAMRHRRRPSVSVCHRNPWEYWSRRCQRCNRPAKRHRNRWQQHDDENRSVHSMHLNNTKRIYDSHSEPDAAEWTRMSKTFFAWYTFGPPNYDRFNQKFRIWVCLFGSDPKLPVRTRDYFQCLPYRIEQCSSIYQHVCYSPLSNGSKMDDSDFAWQRTASNLWKINCFLCSCQCDDSFCEKIFGYFFCCKISIEILFPFAKLQIEKKKSFGACWARTIETEAASK